MAGGITGLHPFAADTGPEGLGLLDTNFNALVNAFNSPANFGNAYIATGSVNTLVVTISAPQVLAAYVEGLFLQVKVNITNTSTTPSLNVNSLGAVTIVNPDGSALVPGQLVAGAYIQVQYSATGPTWVLVGGGLSAGLFSTGLFGNGTAASPSIAFTNSTGTGLYRAGADVLGIAIAGVQHGSVSASAFQMWGPTAAALVDLTPDANTFTVTYSGFVANPTGTAVWSRNGNQATVFFPAGAGTSNATAFGLIGIPAAIQTARDQRIAVPEWNVEDNGVAGGADYAVITTNHSGTWNLMKNGSSTGFTSSGTKGVITGGFTITCLLN